MLKVSVIILLDFVAQAQIAMNPAAVRAQIPAGLNPVQRGQFLGREIQEEEAMLRRPMPTLQRREMLARLGATLGAAAMEGKTAQAAVQAARWTVGEGVAAPATQAAQVVQKGQTAYNAYSGLTSSRFDNYAKSGKTSQSASYPWEFHQPTSFLDGLELFAKVSFGVIIAPILLFAFANFALCVAAAIYFAMMRIKSGFAAAYDMLVAFTQEQGVMSRMSALNLTISPSATKSGILQETLLNPKGQEAKVGTLLSPRSSKGKSRPSRTVPACMLMATEEEPKIGDQLVNKQIPARMFLNTEGEPKDGDKVMGM